MTPMKATVGLASGLVLLALACPTLAQYSSDFRYDPNRTHPSEVIQNLQMLSPEQRVDTAMSLFKGVSDSGPKIATQILLAQRPEYVVQKIVDAIAYDVLFQDKDRRRYAFIVLAAKQEWPNPMTYDLLSDGLLDMRVENVCRLGLEQAPAPQRPLATRALARRLEEWYLQHGPAAGVALEILGSYGKDAMVAAPMVERIFLSPSATWPQNRETAAVTLAQIGGLPMATDIFKHMDTVQYKGAMAGLAWLGTLTPSPYATDSARAGAARQLTLDALALPSAGVVNSALQTLPGVYGAAMFVAVDEQKALNPELKTALISAAEKQADPALRNVLVTALRQLEAAAAY